MAAARVDPPAAKIPRVCDERSDETAESEQYGAGSQVARGHDLKNNQSVWGKAFTSLPQGR